MRCRSLLTMLASCAIVFTQAQFADDLSDGDFTTGPAWSGNDALFVVADDAGNQRLRSNSPGAANYYLSTPSTLVNDAQWEFFFDLRFSTSGANYVDVFLMSDLADLSGAVNGYYLRCGGTADRLELFSSEGGSGFSTGLVSPDGVINSSSSNPFRIKVTRTAAGAWALFYDDGALGTYSSAGSITENTTTSASHFGIRIEQSTAASVPNNHFFDDFDVQAIEVDLTAPSVLSANFTSAFDVDVRFSEPVEEVSAETVANYVFAPSLTINSAIRDGIDASLVHLGLGAGMTNGTEYTVTTTGVQDLVGNVGAASAGTFTYVVPVAAEFRDVVINEIMADPSPVVGLPEAEFLELHNTTTDRVFDLAGWDISDGGTPVAFPSYTLGPGEHVVVMATASLPLFPTITNKVGLTSLPALNNDGDALILREASAVIIDNVSYALSWYQDAIKDDGGWTLEQIDPTSPCSGPSNWRASNAAAGGTPGAQNSIYSIVPDNTSPALASVQVPDANSLVLTFNEAMDAGNIAGGVYTITPTIGVGAAIATGTNTATLTLLDALVVGTIYTIVVEDVTDCPGNIIAGANTASFALPEPIEVGDVVINEVLYDPFGSGSDFVELYNRSTKVLSLAGLQLANVSEGVVGAGVPITSNAVLLLPGEYALVCEDEFDVVTNYPQSHTDRFVVADMPSYNNGEGSVVFLDATDNVLDRFDYNDDLHFELVNSPEGYSLERVSPDRPTSDNTNWQTAADVAGKATPGFINSQYAATPNNSGEMTIEPAIFSPDNDGYQDVLTIAYKFDEPGYVGNMVVYDIAGRESRRLMESLMLGTEGAISWNGMLDSGSLARMGPYIVVLEVFDLAGDVQKFKKTVTLAHRLD
ncbi:MAG: lamin tail domain-containing protein [Flavobacteriales bacterium]|nr:lamin tail domain-containing protein [Flavobacteriales bacterium]